MSVVARLLSSGVARGLAALLAVLLSAVIGGRLGVDRLSLDLADGETAPIACPVVADLPDAGGAALVASGLHWSMHAVSADADDVAVPDTGHRPFPGLLRGSAGGPRAP